jgi:hypothetical protein
MAVSCQGEKGEREKDRERQREGERQREVTFSVNKEMNFSGGRVWTNFRNAGICRPINSSSASARIAMSAWVVM